MLLVVHVHPNLHNMTDCKTMLTAHMFLQPSNNFRLSLGLHRHKSPYSAYVLAYFSLLLRT